MKAQEKITIDYIVYYPGDEVPDLGSWLAIKANEQGYREYIGFSDDVSKLPHYVAHGSSAFCLDTGDYYKYHKQTDIWYKL